MTAAETLVVFVVVVVWRRQVLRGIAGAGAAVTLGSFVVDRVGGRVVGWVGRPNPRTA